MAYYEYLYQTSPSDPPLGADVLTVRAPLALVPAVAEKKACTSLPIATPMLVLAVASVGTSLKLLAVCKTPVIAVPENLYLIDSYVGILFLR